MNISHRYTQQQQQQQPDAHSERVRDRNRNRDRDRRDNRRQSRERTLQSYQHQNSLRGIRQPVFSPPLPLLIHTEQTTSSATLSLRAPPSTTDHLHTASTSSYPLSGYFDADSECLSQCTSTPLSPVFSLDPPPFFPTQVGRNTERHRQAVDQADSLPELPPRWSARTRTQELKREDTERANNYTDNTDTLFLAVVRRRQPQRTSTRHDRAARTQLRASPPRPAGLLPIGTISAPSFSSSL